MENEIKSCLGCKLWDICHTRMAIDEFKSVANRGERNQFKDASSVVAKIYGDIGNKCLYYKRSKEPLELY